jgi:hypothetical protein
LEVYELLKVSQENKLKKLLQNYGFNTGEIDSILRLTYEWLENDIHDKEKERKETNCPFITHMNGEIFAVNKLMEELKS